MLKLLIWDNFNTFKIILEENGGGEGQVVKPLWNQRKDVRRSKCNWKWLSKSFIAVYLYSVSQVCPVEE